MSELVQKLTVDVGAKNSASAVFKQVGDDAEKMARKAAEAAAKEREAIAREGRQLALELESAAQRRDRLIGRADALFGEGAISADVYKAAIAKARKDADPGGLFGLKSVFGEEGSVGALAKIAKGTGAVAGATAVVSVVGSLADAAVKFRDALDSGKDAVAAIQDTLREGLLTSPFIRAGEAINELFTGTQAKVRQITSEIEKADARMKAIADRAQAFALAAAAIKSLQDYNAAEPSRTGASPIPELSQLFQGTSATLQQARDEFQKQLSAAIGVPGARKKLAELLAGRARIGAEPMQASGQDNSEFAMGAIPESDDHIAWRKRKEALDEEIKSLQDRISKGAKLLWEFSGATGTTLLNAAGNASKIASPQSILMSLVAAAPLGGLFTGRGGSSLVAPWAFPGADKASNGTRGIGDALTEAFTAAGADREQANSLAQDAIRHELERRERARSSVTTAGGGDLSPYLSGYRSIGGRSPERDDDLRAGMKALQRQEQENRNFRDQKLKPFIEQFPALIQQLIQALQNPPDQL